MMPVSFLCVYGGLSVCVGGLWLSVGGGWLSVCMCEGRGDWVDMYVM